MSRLLFKGTRVDYETAKTRALAALDYDQPRPASSIAVAIWPDSEFKAQGGGGAASRILKRMEAENLAYWICRRDRDNKAIAWGWIRMPQ